MKLSLIVAIDNNGLIGIDNTIPWPKLKHDIDNFVKITKKGKCNVLICGSKTYHSLPIKMKKDENRKIIVLTRKDSINDLFSNVISHSFENSIELASNSDNIVIIGGSDVYKKALQHNKLFDIYLTKINISIECQNGIYFPMNDLSSLDIELISSFSIEENNINYTINHFQLKN